MDDERCVGKLIHVHNLYCHFAATATAQGENEEGEVIFPWQDLLIYVALRFLQGATGGMGVINNIRSYLWIPVEQYTRQEIAVSTFAHLHECVATPRWVGLVGRRANSLHAPRSGPLT